ncbi:MAG: OmpH family outer membrane protein [Pseudomonadota bacterium]
MLFIKLHQYAISLAALTCLCRAETISAPSSALQLAIPTQQNFLKIPHPKKPSLLTTMSGDTIRNTHVNRKLSLTPFHKMSSDVNQMIEEYAHKRQNFVQKQNLKTRYDELLNDADTLAKEIEDASHEHDIHMEQFQNGNIESGQQAARLTEFIQSRTEPFNSLLLRMDQVIDEITKESTLMPNHVEFTGGPITPRIVPVSSHRVPKEATSLEKRVVSEESDPADAIKKPGILGPLRLGEDEFGEQDFSNQGRR